MIDRDVINVIRKIVLEETVYLRHYIGKVLNNKDALRKGRILVGIDELGLNRSDNAFWAYPRDKNSMSIPAKNDYVEIYFINGDRDRPAYMGVAGEIKNMKPKAYTGLPSKHVIFEDTKNKHQDTFDEIVNVRKLGKTLHKFAARLNDQTLSNATTDPAWWGVYMGWVTAVNAALVSVASTWNGLISGGTPPSDPYMPALLTLFPLFQSAPVPPTQMIGKINSASNQVQIGDK
jgi:hypothetical protein